MVIGNGNVAMDVARMLALTDDELAKTDVADHAIEMLDAKQDPRRSSCWGGADRSRPRSPIRRSRSSASSRTDVIVDPPSSSWTRRSAGSFLESDDVDKTTRVNVEILREFSGSARRRASEQRIVLRFLSSPVEIKGDGKVESIVIGRNELVEEAGGTLRAKDTGEREELSAGLVCARSATPASRSRASPLTRGEG